MNIGSRIRFFRSTDLVRWIMSLLLLPAATASGIAHAPDRWQCDPNNSVATLTLGSGADTTQIGLARISGQMVFEATDPRDLTITFKLDSNGDAAAELALARLAQGKFADSESLAREIIEKDRKTRPDNWQTFRAESLLGASLAGQKKYAKAEPLLLEGYRGALAKKT